MACLLLSDDWRRRAGAACDHKLVARRFLPLAESVFNLLKKLFYLAVILVVGLVLTGWLRTQGVVPGFTNAADPEYRKFSGVEPTSGDVWRWRAENASGGFAYYRLKLSNNSYVNRGGSVLTEQNQPDLPGAPWWWGASSSGRASIEASGSAVNKSRRYEIYDPDAELLLVYGEW